jgi:hypothetical protein
MYLAVKTHPNITYTVHQYVNHTRVPRDLHARAATRILCYIKITKDKGILSKPDKS